MDITGKTSFTWMLQTIQGTGKRQLEKQDESWLSNLELPLKILSSHSDLMDMAVVMTVEPGFMKQQFQQLQTVSLPGH